jgi:hypothetical protein
MERQANQSQATAKAKQPWRKPTVTFMPLQITSVQSGTVTDGLDGNLVP